PTAPGGEECAAATLTECTNTIAGAESVNRVITRECGVVAVDGEYHLNNGSLTLEAGATLAFREGASMNIGYNDSAKLIVHGTDERPVTFTAAGDKSPGAWRGLPLYDHTDRCTRCHPVIEATAQHRDAARPSHRTHRLIPG